MVCGFLLFTSGGFAWRLVAPRALPLARRTRALPCRLADGDIPGNDMMDDFRRALEDVGVADDASAAAERRALDKFVDDRQVGLNTPLDDLTRSLDSVEERLNEQLKGKLAGFESDMLSRIDDALESLRPSTEGSSFDPAAAAARQAVDKGGFSDTLPDDALVVVAGAATPLGRTILRGLGGAGFNWRLRALVAEGSELDIGGVECELVPFAPYRPTKLAQGLNNADAVIIVSAAAAGSDSGGIEPDMVPKLLKALGPNVRRVLMASVHGVDRAGKMPFMLQNVFGQLDKQRAAEQDLILAARKSIPSFGVLRLGKLKPDGDSAPPSAFSGVPRSRAALATGDKLGGELPMSTAAAVLVQALKRPEAVNATFSLGTLETAGDAGAPLASDEAHWDDQFLKLVGPEIYRRPLDGLPAKGAAKWLREWARRFLRPGEQLTTPVAPQDVDNGVLLRFLPSTTGYADFDEEETEDEKWASPASGVVESKAGKPDGALLIVAESQPTPRVRVMRAEMEEKTVVKVMSETAVLERLERDLTKLEKTRK